MFSLNTLPKTVAKKQRIGRGNNRGKNSGKGNKGQQKRAGKTRVGFEGGGQSLIRRTPKLRGHGFAPATSRQTAVLSLTMLEKTFIEGETVSLATLLEKALISDKITKVRIINSGNLTKKLKVDQNENLHLTKSVQAMF